MSSFRINFLWWLCSQLAVVCLASCKCSSYDMCQIKPCHSMALVAMVIPCGGSDVHVHNSKRLIQHYKGEMHMKLTKMGAKIIMWRRMSSVTKGFITRHRSDCSWLIHELLLLGTASCCFAHQQARAAVEWRDVSLIPSLELIHGFGVGWMRNSIMWGQIWFSHRLWSIFSSE